MTDPTTPSIPEESTAVPTASEAPVAPAPPVAAPAAPTANPYTASATGHAAATPVKQGLSLASFILGLAGVVFSVFLGFILGLLAVILGFRARKLELTAPKWMSLTGIITGFVAIAISIIVGLWLLSLLVSLFYLPIAYGNY